MISCKSNQRSKKDILFQATYDSGVGGCSLVFYKDSTCLWIGGIATDDKEGKYHLQDSIITLEGIPLETCLKSNKLLITTINPHQKTNGDIILLQIDSKLRIVDSTYIFTKVH
jgi:hypothetical protein